MKKICIILVICLCILMGCVSSPKKFNPKKVDVMNQDIGFYSKDMINVFSTGKCIDQVLERGDQSEKNK